MTTVTLTEDQLDMLTTLVVRYTGEYRESLYDDFHSDIKHPNVKDNMDEIQMLLGNYKGLIDTLSSLESLLTTSSSTEGSKQ